MKSVRILTAGLIDYAGLFPPAQLGMDQTVANFREYLNGPDASMLGRFVVPVDRLTEFSEAASAILPHGEHEPWRLAALLPAVNESAVGTISEFNSTHGPGSVNGSAVVDVVETKASDPNTVHAVSEALPAGLAVFVETPPAADDALFAAIAAAGYSAKIRTGGIEAAAFPRADEIVRFMESCLRNEIAFKATAGLHHIVCSRYPLTYEPGSEKAEMFGYLNLFASAIFLYHGASPADAEAMLQEGDPAAISFSQQGLHWRDRFAGLDAIQSARSEFAISFGSCSFTEPVDELAQLLADNNKSGS
jgi:hypothetical protein